MGISPCEFESHSEHLIFNKNYSPPEAQMVKSVDTLVSGTSGRKAVQVRVLFWAQKNLYNVLLLRYRGFFMPAYHLYNSNIGRFLPNPFINHRIKCGGNGCFEMMHFAREGVYEREHVSVQSKAFQV